jgi:hypothetical protein
MYQAAKLQFGRVVDEFVRWRAVPVAERSPAPAWWWGPAFQVLRERQQMPVDWCARLGLPDGAAYADGARIFLAAFADQIFLPLPDDFPRKADWPPPSRELHPQPSDDGAFQP